MKGRPAEAIVAERFWKRVDRRGPDECWNWLGYLGPSGHGLTSHLSLPVSANRKAWILTHGPIKGGMCVNHRCDNKLCCNPAHMYLGTRADNMVDRWANTPPEARTFGRSRVLNDAQLERLWEMRRSGKTLKACAEKFDVHIATICRYITQVRAEKVKTLQSVRLSALRNSKVGI